MPSTNFDLNTTFNNSISRLKPLFNYLEKQRENEHFYRSVELGATFLLIAFFLFFAIKPTASAISSLLGDINSKEVTTAALKNKINDIISAQDAFSQIQEQYQVVDSALPDRPSFYDAANQFTLALSSAGLTPSSFGFQTDAADTGLNNLNIKSFTLTSPIKIDYLNGQNIISQILNNRRLIDLPGFTFSATQTDQANVVQLNLSSNFYYWDQPNE